MIYFLYRIVKQNKTTDYLAINVFNKSDNKETVFDKS